MCPYAVYARWKLQSIEGFLEVENRLRGEVNRLTVENGRLKVLVNKMEKNVNEFHNQNQKLKSSVEELKGVEESIKDMALDSSVNLDDMKRLIHENSVILSQIKLINKQTQMLNDGMCIQNLFSLVIKCDVDNSGDFTDNELHLICQGMKGLEPGFKEEVFYRVLRERREQMGLKRNTLAGLMEVVRNIMADEDLPDEMRIVERKKVMRRKGQ